MENKPKIGLRERKKAKTMASIQKHAMRLFRELGYNATTVEQIADAAEISPSTFFRYFATKEDVVVTDTYDPMIIAAFEEQPPDISILQAIRNAMSSGVNSMTADELDTMRERNQLIMSVPELRAAMLNNMIQNMQFLTGIIAKRVNRSLDDLTVHTFVGAIVGTGISVMLYYAEHPNEDFVQLFEQAFSKLDEGLLL
ncbi:TetR family transcriptional regulator [Paenibacillus albiflavus]|uniref:TetR family transcriptional regulator n=1 Tax=Paenibacillus albiflavus TaxID=2545760 RepID=A0A4R4E8P2_9BACL|nr:TetR family transcriptional regulator [Paenibacillus albiflavus]TCZ75343.1 TetR family transcriptional regulator [Paenibacillus albiflavus]